MNETTRLLDRCLTLLRNRIREHGFTQLEVQEQLGWGRSYISQLLTKQKALRLEQVLLILQVIGASPEEFFTTLFRRAAPRERQAAHRYAQRPLSGPGHVQAHLDSLIGMLESKGLLTASEAASLERHE